MAITISGQNNNDRILASDGVLDSISGFNVVGVMTAGTFDVTGKTSTGHLSVGSNIHIGNAGIITATTLVGNVTGNINHTSNILLQISGSEKFRVGTSGQLGIGGANYGTSGQVLTSGGSGSAATWSTVSGTTINNNANNRIVTGSGTANTLEAETTLEWNGTNKLTAVNQGSGYPDFIFSIKTVAGGGESERFRVGNGPFRIGNTNYSQNSYADALVVGSDYNDRGITIVSGNSNQGNIFFGDDGDNDIGKIQYVHSDNSMRFTTNTGERLRITSDGFVGINEANPKSGLTIGKLGDYSTDDGNTYYIPVGKWSSVWNSVNAIDNNTDYWVGFVGGYAKTSSSVNIALAPNRANVGNQAGMYISGEATGSSSADFTVGKIIGGSATGQGTSGNVRATKSELFRITSDYLVTVGNNNIASTTQPSKLRVQGSYVNAVGPFGILEFKNRDNSGEAVCSIRGVRDAVAGGNYSAGLTFHTNSANPASASDGDHERFRITSTGKIGIGDGSPDALLSIKGDSNEGSNPSIRLKDGTDTREAWISNDSGDLLLAAGGDDNAYHSRIRVMDANQIYFDIGSTAGAWKLTSDKSLNSGNLALNGLNDGDNNYTQINSDNHANSLFGLNLRLRRSSNNGTHEVEQVNSHGSIGAAGIYMGGNGSNNNSGIVFYAYGQGNSAGHNFGQNDWRMRIRPTSAGDCMEVRTTQNSGNAGMIIFRDGNLDFCGQITSNGSNNTTSYNTSSDYRLKTKEALITDGITRVKNLKPYQFEWKSDLGTKVDGFFAHEAQTVVPESVVGTKDEVDSDGNPKYQGIDQAKLVPLLTAALQEAITEIETLKTKVSALEGS